MKPRPIVEFQSSLPNDAVEGEHDFVQFGGRNVVEVIAAQLSALGYEVSEPVDMGFLGWELYARMSGRRFGFRLNDLEDVKVVHAFDFTWQIWRRRPSFATFVDQLDKILRQAGHFSNIGWYANYENGSPHPHPID